MSFLSLGSRCVLQYLLYDGGLYSRALLLCSGMMLSFVSRGSWRDIAGGRGSLSGCCVCFPLLLLPSVRGVWGAGMAAVVLPQLCTYLGGRSLSE